jgi:hypothetical protein
MYIILAGDPPRAGKPGLTAIAAAPAEMFNRGETMESNQMRIKKAASTLETAPGNPA